MIHVLLLVLGLDLSFALPNLAQTDPPGGETATAVLRREGRSLETLITSKLARDFLQATPGLPVISPRKLYLDSAKKTYLTEAAASTLTEKAKGTLQLIPVDESFYYTTKYGSPLAYARPLDLLGQSGLGDVSGLKILDFGYGTVGHLRLLAGLGADVTGVNVDPLLHALYSAPEDQGVVKNSNGQAGRIRLIDGRFPVDEAIRSVVGGGFDLIISKNTLKRGYVHPERPVEPRRLLNLGVEDAAFVKAFHEALKPGGRVLIYNICPAPVSPASLTRTGPRDAVRSTGTSGRRPVFASSHSTAKIPRPSERSPTPSGGIKAIRRSISRPTCSRGIRCSRNRPSHDPENVGFGNLSRSLWLRWELGMSLLSLLLLVTTPR